MDEPSPAAPEAGQVPPEDQGQEPAGGEQPPEGQEPGDGRTYTEPYVKQLRRENAQARTRQAELEERLREYEDKDKTELERLTAAATEAERRASESEARLLRYEVAAEHGLDMDAAKFLTGSTREEIELRAEELAKLLTDKGRPPAGTFDGGARGPVPEIKSPEEAHQDLLRQALGHRT
jgi:hypothetical protein